MPSDRFFLEFERDKEQMLASIRAEVGWPAEHDEYEHLDADMMWSYITALENAYTAERRLRRSGTP